MWFKADPVPRSVLGCHSSSKQRESEREREMLGGADTKPSPALNLSLCRKSWSNPVPVNPGQASAELSNFNGPSIASAHNECKNPRCEQLSAYLRCVRYKIFWDCYKAIR
mmetsp:Transcript_4607/g.8310  ORF Transcript_4607/g.8310 Transcript_4607/m.8310 type:complete len:110 (-) Transcript_4607:118-447(-)